jgi:hypothetical protein
MNHIIPDPSDDGDTDGVHRRSDATSGNRLAGRLDPALARRPDAVSLDQARLRMLFYLDWVSAFRAPSKDVAQACPAARSAACEP